MDLRHVDRRLGKLHFQILQCFYDDLGDSEIPEPLPVCRYDKPGRPGGAAPVQSSFESVHIFVPMLSFFEIAGVELPVPRGIVESLLESPLLLVLADMEEELEDLHVIVGQ